MIYEPPALNLNAGDEIGWVMSLMVYRSKSPQITRFIVRYERVSNDKNYKTWVFTELDIGVLKMLLSTCQAARVFHVHQPKRRGIPFYVEFTKIVNASKILRITARKYTNLPWYERIATFLFDEAGTGDVYVGELDGDCLKRLASIHDVGCCWGFIFFANQPDKYCSELSPEHFEVDKLFLDSEEVLAVVYRDFVTKKIAIAAKSSLDIKISDFFWHRKGFIVDGKIGNVFSNIFSSEDLINLAGNTVVHREN